MKSNNSAAAGVYLAIGSLVISSALIIQSWLGVL